jgi:hypothetical protein
MPNNPSRQRKGKKEQSQPPLQTERRHPLVRKILASWWGRVIAIFAGIGAIAGAADFYNRLYPEIHPILDSSAPTDFRIKNTNPIFNMSDVVLVCDVFNAAFDTDNGLVGFSMPITSGTVNTSIPHGTAATYPCDASLFMKLESGKICLIGMCTADQGSTLTRIKLATEILRIGVKYQILWVTFNYQSEPFTWNGHYWQEGPAFR